tara:strand:- start:289 stop:498 length:210 start_codon:yes stop_codon:yes gene_type:complete
MKARQNNLKFDSLMPKKHRKGCMVKKSELDEKICLTCKRPFSWRKKWARDWANVKFCSKRCQGEFNTKS